MSQSNKEIAARLREHCSSIRTKSLAREELIVLMLTAADALSQSAAGLGGNPQVREDLTSEDVRAAGGIIHRDGNVFFKNLEQLNSATRTERGTHANLTLAKLAQGADRE